MAYFRFPFFNGPYRRDHVICSHIEMKCKNTEWLKYRKAIIVQSRPNFVDIPYYQSRLIKCWYHILVKVCGLSLKIAHLAPAPHRYLDFSSHQSLRSAVCHLAQGRRVKGAGSPAVRPAARPARGRDVDDTCLQRCESRALRRFGRRRKCGGCTTKRYFFSRFEMRSPGVRYH